MAELEASAGAAAPAPAPERISVDAVIFDLDGTLLDYEGLSHELLKAPLEARGVEGFTWDLQASIVGSRPERWSEQILEALDVPRDVLTPEAYVADYMAELDKISLRRHRSRPRPSSSSGKRPQEVATSVVERQASTEVQARARRHCVVERKRRHSLLQRLQRCAAACARSQ